MNWYETKCISTWGVIWHVFRDNRMVKVNIETWVYAHNWLRSHCISTFVSIKWHLCRVVPFQNLGKYCSQFSTLSWHIDKILSLQLSYGLCYAQLYANWDLSMACLSARYILFFSLNSFITHLSFSNAHSFWRFCELLKFCLPQYLYTFCKYFSPAAISLLLIH